MDDVKDLYCIVCGIKLEYEDEYTETEDGCICTKCELADIDDDSEEIEKTTKKWEITEDEEQHDW